VSHFSYILHFFPASLMLSLVIEATMPEQYILL